MRITVSRTLTERRASPPEGLRQNRLLKTDRTSNASTRRTLRIGFVPLIDASPIIAAAELGFFNDEGLSVELERQIGWGNVRDKLTFGHLDASHALVGMPLASALGWDWFAQP